jgi:hypothetical protein
VQTDLERDVTSRKFVPLKYMSDQEDQSARDHVWLSDLYPSVIINVLNQNFRAAGYSDQGHYREDLLNDSTDF